MKEQTLKQIYSLSYDRRKSAPDWYNKLIKKTYNQIESFEVAKMLIHDILPELAIEKIIDYFIINPFDGYWIDGDYLKLFVEKSEMFFASKNPALSQMLDIIENMDSKTAQSKEQWGYDYDCDEEGCQEFLKMLLKAKEIISQHKIN
ncbi:MAG: contact-dependent growth inhibition system immunity protein [Firmicutes bacterium]|nr:contact-dependent growth inhibition system immunity protein [Bacillota bacterium]